LPDTVAVPTAVPPVVQLVGAEDRGPKTLMVIVPEALEPDELERTEPIELALMAVPMVPVEGPVAVSAEDALATVISDKDGQVLCAKLLFASPL
jgi:hypothetical protein